MPEAENLEQELFNSLDETANFARGKDKSTGGRKGHYNTASVTM